MQLLLANRALLATFITFVMHLIVSEAVRRAPRDVKGPTVVSKMTTLSSGVNLTLSLRYFSRHFTRVQVTMSNIGISKFFQLVCDCLKVCVVTYFGCCAAVNPWKHNLSFSLHAELTLLFFFSPSFLSHPTSLLVNTQWKAPTSWAAKKS